MGDRKKESEREKERGEKVLRSGTLLELNIWLLNEDDVVWARWIKLDAHHLVLFCCLNCFFRGGIK